MRFRSYSLRRGFSLIESIVVLSVIAVLVALILPAAFSISRSYQLNTAAQSVLSQLGLARQTATTYGRGVEVRFYFLPEPDNPSGEPSVYRGMQCFVEGDPVTNQTTVNLPLEPLGKPLFFSKPIVMLDDSAKTTVLNLPLVAPTFPCGEYLLNYNYISFRFRPNGSTDLIEENTGIILCCQTDALEPTGFPKNFQAIEISRRNGVATSYRP